jgi:hypothetical protein
MSAGLHAEKIATMQDIKPETYGPVHNPESKQERVADHLVEGKKVSEASSQFLYMAKNPEEKQGESITIPIVRRIRKRRFRVQFSIWD